MATDDYITKWRKHIEKLDELVTRFERRAEFYCDAQDKAFAEACRAGSEALRASVDAVEEMQHDTEVLEAEDEPFGKSP
jgi:hypothetical protein